MNVLVVLPIIIPLLSGVLSMVLSRNAALQRVLAVLGTATLTFASALLLWKVRGGTILTMAMGDWDAPFGIIFVADALAALLVTLTGAIGFATAVYGLGDMDARRERWGYYPLLHILLAGVCGAFLTGDLFNLFVWFEVLLIASFVLLALGGTRGQLEGAVKYVVVNLLSSVLFLAAVGILYGLTGTVNMADLAIRLADTEHPGLVLTVAMLFLVTFGIKSALFPLFFWLPASYHTPPAAISALFAALLTKVGVYALVRTSTLIFDQPAAHTMLLAVAILTMAVGVLGALAQNEIRRILSFNTIASIGYIIMGLALGSPLAITAAVFFLAHDILIKANLFFVAGVVQHLHGTYRLERLGGLARRNPLLASLFLLASFSLAGVPPLSGFWSKFLIVRAALEQQAYIATAVALIVGILVLWSMVRIWSAAFWAPLPPQTPSLHPSRATMGVLMAPIVGLGAATVLIGLFPAPLFELSELVASQLLDSSSYLDAVGVTP